MRVNLYIASCTEDGGIYRFDMDPRGKLTLAEKTPMRNPMYMAVEGEKMYIILRDPFEDNKNSGIVVYDTDAEGSLASPSDICTTMGEVACHIAVDKGAVYSANYVSGSVIKLPDTLRVHSGSGPHPTRQTKAHTHFVGLTPDKKYLCAVDLGVDTIFVYNKETMELYSKAQVPSGHGARHIIFSEDGRYMFCANELASSVSAFAYSEGRLELIDTASVLPEGCDTVSTAAAIRIYDGKIYISNRGHDSVSEVGFADGRLHLERCIDCKGKRPRDFDFVNDFMICTNEEDGSVTVFDCKKDFCHIGSYAVPAALCVVGTEKKVV